MILILILLLAIARDELNQCINLFLGIGALRRFWIRHSTPCDAGGCILHVLFPRLCEPGYLHICYFRLPPESVSALRPVPAMPKNLPVSRPIQRNRPGRCKPRRWRWRSCHGNDVPWSLRLPLGCSQLYPGYNGRSSSCVYSPSETFGKPRLFYIQNSESGRHTKWGHHPSGNWHLASETKPHHIQKFLITFTLNVTVCFIVFVWIAILKGNNFFACEACKETYRLLVAQLHGMCFVVQRVEITSKFSAESENFKVFSEKTFKQTVRQTIESPSWGMYSLTIDFHATFCFVAEQKLGWQFG